MCQLHGIKKKQIPVQLFKLLPFRHIVLQLSKLVGRTEQKEMCSPKHGVAGQNAIRGEDAAHNWVWHVLMAFHLDKRGSTAGRERGQMGSRGAAIGLEAPAEQDNCVSVWVCECAWSLGQKEPDCSLTQTTEPVVFIGAAASLSVPRNMALV